jgi:hypothetical protein
MSTDYRAELQRLLGAVENDVIDTNDGLRFQAAVNRARAALAQPQPEGPTDNELLGYMLKAAASVPGGQCTGILDWNEEAIAAARAVIAADRARFGRPALTPVPVSERLPGPEAGEPSASDIEDYSKRATARFQQMDALERHIDFNQVGWSQTDAGIKWQRLMNEQGADEIRMGL